jgi:octaprenyl-diphosphate synthase
MLERIKAPVGKEITRYEEYLAAVLRNDIQLVDEMVAYVLSTRGKAIRPLLALLSASEYAGGRTLPTDTLVTAMLLEMMHTASLIHDDVVDKSLVRRGMPSVNAIWHSHNSVLIGDYILSKAFSTGLKRGQADIVTYISDCMSVMCEGELMQSSYSDRLDMNREAYLEIIYKKTAALIGTSCGAGAMSVGSSEADVMLMREIGDCMGMAFQIKDDILDYAPSAETGKAQHNDLIEHKITLPLLSVMEQMHVDEREEVRGLLSDMSVHPENEQELHQLVINRGGIDAAEAEMNAYCDKARKLLERCPASPYRDSLALMCDYIGLRHR